MDCFLAYKRERSKRPEVKELHNQALTLWRVLNPEKAKKHSLDNYYRKPFSQWSQVRKDMKNFAARLRREAIRAKVLALYGGECECCGETMPEFLGIDHVNNDGKKDRATFGRDFYAYLLKLGKRREDLRLLCHNCNLARELYGACPHEQAKTEASAD